MHPGRPAPGSPIASSRARRPAWLLLLGAILLCAHAPASAQRRAMPPDIDRLRAWRMAMDLHVPGEADVPAREVASWSSEELERALTTFVYLTTELRKLGGRSHVLEARLGDLKSGVPREIRSWLGLTPEEMVRGDGTRVLKRAALLHTDIATLLEARLLAPAGPPPQGRRPASVTVNDGRFEGYEVDSEHWDFARAVLDHVRPGPSPDPEVRDWYRAVSAYHVSQLNYGELGRHLQHARTVVPGDAVLSMMAGVRHQAFASSRVQASLATVALPPGMTLSVGSRDRELAEARQAYRDALELDPGLVEARIRLGRVLADEGKPAEAAGELRTALAVAGEPMLLYLAALFLGEQETALGRLEDAAAAFERARSLYPTAPSPHLAMSHLARARGDRTTAWEALDRAMRLAASRAADDPWWSFIASAGRVSDEWMTQVRRALAGESPP